MKRVQVFFSGHVQGVGFRFTARAVARGFRVTGYVKNLPDRRVEVVAEGEEEELQRFVEAIQQEMGTLIREAKTSYSPALACFDRFDIAF